MCLIITLNECSSGSNNDYNFKVMTKKWYFRISCNNNVIFIDGNKSQVTLVTTEAYHLHH